jgi:hypothetical protein
MEQHCTVIREVKWGDVRWLPCLMAGLFSLASAGEQAVEPAPCDAVFEAVFVKKVEESRSTWLHAEYLENTARGSNAYLATIGSEKPLTPKETPFWEDPSDWYEVLPHPYLSRVIPGASFYLSPVEQLTIGSARMFFALRYGKVYDLPNDVNSLLYDCGMRFEATDVPIWAQVLALLYSVGEEERRAPVQLFGEDVFEGVLAGEKPLFPQMTIESIALDTARADKPDYPCPVGMVQQATLGLLIGDSVSTLLIQTAVWRDGDLALLCPYTLQRYIRLPPPCSTELR